MQYKAYFMAYDTFATSSLIGGLSELGHQLVWFYPTIAEAQFLQSLAIREKLPGQDHRTVAESLNNIAVLYRTQGKYPQAEEYYLRAHDIKEQILGPNHPAMATSNNNLAVVYEAQGKYTEACTCYQKAIEICERKLGPDHLHTKSSRTDYESLLKKINRMGGA